MKAKEQIRLRNQSTNEIDVIAGGEEFSPENYNTLTLERLKKGKSIEGKIKTEAKPAKVAEKKVRVKQDENFSL